MQITDAIFGETKDGEIVKSFCLENKNGCKVTILNYGCTVNKIEIPTKNGAMVDVCLGYNSVSEYVQSDTHFGAVVGRFANRIEKGTFELNGKTHNLAVNNGPNHLHGGVKGFDRYVWNHKITDNSLQFSRLSPHLEENYPGNLQTTIIYKLTDDNEIVISYVATTDEDTPINLTNHTYFNLAGKGDILGHKLQIFADEYLENDENCLPTGRILNVKNTPFDFTNAKTIGAEIDENHIQLKNGNGYDHNFILNSQNHLKKAAVATDDATGLTLTTWTTQPGVQLYSGNFLTQTEGKSPIDRRFGFCLETQHFPNSLSHSHFPTAILKAGETYNHTTIYEFSGF